MIITIARPSGGPGVHCCGSSNKSHSPPHDWSFVNIFDRESLTSSSSRRRATPPTAAVHPLKIYTKSKLLEANAVKPCQLWGIWHTQCCSKIDWYIPCFKGPSCCIPYRIYLRRHADCSQIKTIQTCDITARVSQQQPKLGQVLCVTTHTGTGSR